MHRFSIRTILVLLVLAVALPLAAGLDYITQLRIAGRTDFALEMARGAAASARALMQLLTAEVRGLAERMAMRDCSVVQGFDVSPYARFATVALIDRAGTMICHNGPISSARPVSIAQTPEFRRLSDRREFVTGEPAQGPLSGHWEVLFLQPRFDARGEWIGAAAVALDLTGLEELLRYRLLDARDVIAVFTNDGRLITRSSDSAQWIGHAVEITPDIRAVMDGRTQSYAGPGVDGRYRIGVAERMPETGWYVFAALDRERVLANIHSQQTIAAAVLAVIVAAAVVLGLWLSYRIARPIAALAESAAWSEENDAPPRVPVGGPKEVAAVARRLNEAAAARFAAEAHLRRAERFDRHFLQYSTIAYARVGVNGQYQVVNQHWRALFGQSDTTDIEAKMFGDFVPPEEAVLRREQLREVVETAKPVTRERETTTKLGKRAFMTTLFPILGETGAVEAIGIVGIDITELRAAERERERLTAILMRVTDAVPVCLSYVDADDRYVWTNSRNGERLGLAPEWIVGKAIEEVVAEGYEPIRPLLAALRDGKSIHDEVAWRRDDAPKFYERYAVPDFDRNGRYCGHTMVWFDVTERKLAEVREHKDAERMRALSHRLIEAQEAERRAIARELHDEVGQSLTAVHATLQSLEPLATDLDLAARLADSTASVNRAIAEIRTASMRLRPSVLDDLGLVPALRWLVGQQSRAAGLSIALEIDALSSDVPPEIATACFRIAQEAITNVIRHARARHATIRLSENAGRLTIEIADDGAGFDLDAAQSAATAGQGSGLSGMRERADLLGGTFSIRAAPGQGTLVQASFPLASTANTHSPAHAE